VPAKRPPSRRTVARRRLVALGAAAVAAFGVGVLVASEADQESAGSQPETSASPQLPRGGRDLLPEHRLVGFYGAPQSEELGALGVGEPPEAGRRLVEQARAYRGDRPVLPVFELLATIAAADPGPDGLHRIRQPHSTIRSYLREARRRRGLLLLDVQPGRAEFADEIERLRRYLRQPDVGLALDPEWNVGPDEVPGAVIGSVDASTVNEISADLARMVERYDLPEKLFVVHQFTADMIANRGALESRAGLATVLNVDGFGDQANKVAKYRALRPSRTGSLYSGFKLFYSEDTGLMDPGRVMRLSPTPGLIIYE
jgi:hypothetical protein